MGTMRSCLCVLMALFMLVSVSAQTLAPEPSAAFGPSATPMGPSASDECFNQLLNMSDCLSYVTSGSNVTVPDKPCCPELAGLVESNPICLCGLLSQSSSFGIKIDLNRALKLPSVCNVIIPYCCLPHTPEICQIPGPDQLTHLETRLETHKIDSTDSATSTYLSRFNDSKNSITSLLRTTTDPSCLPDISASISALEKLAAENSYSLPFYEARSALKTISDLKQNLENLLAQLIPRKKFAFRSKPTKTQTQIPQNDVVSAPNETKPKSNVPVRESPVRDKHNKVLFRDFKGSEIGEFRLSGLDSCEVRLVGCVNALFINKLKDFRVYAGPVTGSILIEEVGDCVLVMASHQIRTHFAKSCDFYLRVRSRPIIEDSNGVRFGRYCLNYEGIEEDLEAAGLSEETGNWGNVDDFKWLRAVQSPN